jgi:hypothetical protein
MRLTMAFLLFPLKALAGEKEDEDGEDVCHDDT